jgi:hypothetical protein
MDYPKQGFRLNTLRGAGGRLDGPHWKPRAAWPRSTTRIGGAAQPGIPIGLSRGAGCGPSGEQEYQRGEN